MSKIVKRPASTLFDEMNKCHETGKHRIAIIVFSQENCNYCLFARELAQ